MSTAPARQHSETTADPRPARQGGESAALFSLAGLLAKRQPSPAAVETAPDMTGPHDISSPRGRQRAPAGPDNATITALAARFITAHAARPLTSADLVGATGVGERELRAALHRQTGLGLVGFMLMVRLDQARAWLSTNRESRSQAPIAAALGFSSSAVFGRAYSRRFGETMTQTRRLAVRAGEDRSVCSNNSRSTGV